MQGDPGEPTAEEIEQGQRVLKAVIGEVNLLLREGVQPKAAMAGLATACADVITTIWGNEHVPAWFAAQAEHSAQLIRESRH
jgi:hypothetical protein